MHRKNHFYSWGGRTTTKSKAVLISLFIFTFCTLIASAGQTADSWIVSINTTNTIQNVTIGIDPNGTEKMDDFDSVSSPPYPADKVFLLLDGYFAKNIKQNDNGASWSLKVRVPRGQTTKLRWDPEPTPEVNIRIMDGNSEIHPGQEISGGLHEMIIYANYGSNIDFTPIINIYSHPVVVRNILLSGSVIDDNLATLAYKIGENTKLLPYSQDGFLYKFDEEIVLEDGDYTIEIEASDSKTTTRRLVNFTVDNTIPDVNISDILIYGQNVIFTIHATDSNAMSTVYYQVKGEDYQESMKWFATNSNSNSYEQSLKSRDLKPGKYTIEVIATDCVENVAYGSKEFEITDVYNPEITIISPKYGGTYASFPEVNVTVNEEASLIYNLNGYNETSVAQLEKHLIAGENSLTVDATDLAGHRKTENVIFYLGTGQIDNKDEQNKATFGNVPEPSDESIRENAEPSSTDIIKNKLVIPLSRINYRIIEIESLFKIF